MTKLEHSDRILNARKGDWLLSCDTLKGVDMRAGGQIEYPIGSRFRVRSTCGDLIWCHDEDARNISFDREDMSALEIEV